MGQGSATVYIIIVDIPTCCEVVIVLSEAEIDISKAEILLTVEHREIPVEVEKRDVC